LSFERKELLLDGKIFIIIIIINLETRNVTKVETITVIQNDFCSCGGHQKDNCNNHEEHHVGYFRSCSLSELSFNQHEIYYLLFLQN
jgi:hypothetical protein